MIPTPRAVLDEEPSAPGPDDGAGARAAGPDDGAGGMVAGSMTAGGIWKEYTDWNSFTLDGMRLDALPGFFAEILEANPGSIVHVQVNKDGVFERAFLMLDACVKAALRIGRKIAGSDFGHLQHSLFDGCEGAGWFKTGSGYEFPVWLMYATGNEDEDKWRYISTQILRHPQGAELYSDLTEFSDRSKGKKAGFDAQFPGMIPLDCAGHILENVRKVARLHKEHFSNSDFWQLQGSKNANVGACHIDNWKANYPHCCEYLLGIPAETWVWFQQVKNGGSTYRERTSNLAEHDQAVQSKKGMGMRGLDPLSYFAEGLKRMCNALSQEADRMEECKAAGVELVPHALEKMRANEALSTRRTASGGRNVYVVRAILATGVDSRVCNWETRECDCGKWQDEHLPCADAFAVGREKGLCAIEVMRHGAEKSYFVTDYLKDLQFQLAVPPTDDDLRLRARAAEEEANGSSRIAAWLRKEPTRRQRTAALNYDAIISGGHGTGVGLPPPKKRAKTTAQAEAAGARVPAGERGLRPRLRR